MNVKLVNNFKGYIDLSNTNVPFKLKSLLLRVAENVDYDFSGLGVIVWDGTSILPVYPIREKAKENISQNKTFDILIEISRKTSIYHDGFHLLDPSLNLIKSSLYFSPTINSTFVPSLHANEYGGRYLAAAFGSFLDGVICTGVLSSNYGPCVFQKGREI